MAERQTREALAVERDRQADTIMRFILFSPESARWGAVIPDAIGRYSALSDEIARRGEPVQSAGGVA